MEIAWNLGDLNAFVSSFSEEIEWICLCLQKSEQQKAL